MESHERVEERYGAVTVLRGPRGGAYPHGNSLVIRGSAATMLVDPSYGLDLEAHPTDLVLVSHAHEDHTAGLGRVDATVHAHESDVAALRDIGTFFDGLGMPDPVREQMQTSLTRQFDLADRPDTHAFTEGAEFDLGDRTVTVVHLPGHTRGHCGLMVEPDGFLYLADIDLTSFGPYYGDLGSDLGDFERSLQRVAALDARWYGTFHQKGVIVGAEEFRRRLAAYRGVVADRDERLLALLERPRSVADIAAHRLVYRPHVDEPHVATVERRTAQRHLERLLAQGAVEEVEPGRYRVVPW